MNNEANNAGPFDREAPEVKTFVALAGVKHALHLGEELLEFRNAYDTFVFKAEHVDNPHAPLTPYQHVDLHAAWKTMVDEALDVLWLAHHVGIAKAFAAAVRKDVDGSISGIHFSTENAYYWSDNNGDRTSISLKVRRTLLRDILPYRSVLAIDRVIEVLDLAKENGILIEAYNDWVAHQVSRGRARSSYASDIVGFLATFSEGWQNTFGSERPEPRLASEWDYYTPLVKENSFPVTKKVLDHRAEGASRIKWVAGPDGFLHRRYD